MQIQQGDGYQVKPAEDTAFAPACAPVADIVILLRRAGDEMDAGAALVITIAQAGPSDAQGERDARRAAASGNAAGPGDTWSSASGIRINLSKMRKNCAFSKRGQHQGLE
jgi:hypothetical protein